MAVGRAARHLGDRGRQHRPRPTGPSSSARSSRGWLVSVVVVASWLDTALSARSLALYCTLVWLTAVSLTFWRSVPRYDLALFPAVIVVADLTSRASRGVRPVLVAAERGGARVERVRVRRGRMGGVIVDAHVHILPDRVRDNARGSRPHREPWFAACHARGERMASAESLVAAMDEQGVDRAVCFSWPFADAAHVRRGERLRRGRGAPSPGPAGRVRGRPAARPRRRRRGDAVRRPRPRRDRRDERRRAGMGAPRRRGRAGGARLCRRRACRGRCTAASRWAASTRARDRRRRTGSWPSPSATPT